MVGTRMLKVFLENLGQPRNEGHEKIRVYGKRLRGGESIYVRDQAIHR